jgi:hypothetical protein
MAHVMPSQVVETIDDLFPHAKQVRDSTILTVSNIHQLLGVLSLLKEVPDQLIVLSPADYADLVLAKSTIEETLAVWRSRGNVGAMAHVKGLDTITVPRRALANARMNTLRPISCSSMM